MGNITGVASGDYTDLFIDWWQFILIAFILLSIGIGSSLILYTLFVRFRGRWLIHRSSPYRATSSVRSFIRNTAKDLSHRRIERIQERPGSYGVYLGEFSSPPTQQQVKLLAQWDLLIFDPLQKGIVEAMLTGRYALPSQSLARLDVANVAGEASSEAIKSIAKWLISLMETCKVISSHNNIISGVLISNWEGWLTVPLLKEFLYLVDSLGLCAYLEAAAPDFLIDAKLADLVEVKGIVIRNGTISPNGEERDAFQMSEMRPTIKAFVSQACVRNFVVLLWETLDHNVLPLNAVIKRTYQWSRFYSAIPWIGSENALESPELSLKQIEPLGAFDWLKELKVMEFHTKWRCNRMITSQYVTEIADSVNQLHQLLSVIPITSVKRSSSDGHNGFDQSSISSTTTWGGQSVNEWSYDSPNTASCGGDSTSSASVNSSSLSVGSLTWLSLWDRGTGNPISKSLNGSSYDYLGCFPLGFSATKKAFTDVVQYQLRFQEMNLLEDMNLSRLYEIGQQLKRFSEHVEEQVAEHLSNWPEIVQELAYQLSQQTSDTTCLRVHVGLDQGFQVQPGIRFWGVYSLDEELVLDIFLSRNVPDVGSAILHTFLSSRGFSRYECFQVELYFSEWSKSLDVSSELPSRVHHDLTLLSPSELLNLLQTLNLTPAAEDPSLLNSIRLACENQLLDCTDFEQLKHLTTTGYLSGRESPNDLIRTRIEWYQQIGCQHATKSSCLNEFLQIDQKITQILRERDLETLSRITDCLSTAFDVSRIDSRIDMIAFSIFCAMRRHAFDEAYMEVTDRNTLFNDQSDQAAAFAELFATGARCEAYFDLTPSAFGKLLSDRYRAYHHRPGYEPPIWSDLKPTTQSAYAAAKIDVDPDTKMSSMSLHQRATFLSVFAIPALLDIILLTTTGRGLYLSGTMSDDEKHSATLALMISLLISGAVGTWITCGGSYYLISMAFSAMNMFVMTRLVGGLAFTLAIAVIGLIAVSATNGFNAGIVFFLYLIALTTYLSLLATLANFQYPGSGFQSGRPVIVMVVPFLFISPVVAIWVPNRDIYIYLSVLYTFLFLLTMGVRHTGSKWTTWYLNIEKLTDQKLRDWYIETQKNGNEKGISGMTEPAVLKLARSAVMKEVTDSRKRFQRKKSRDPLVLALAKSYDATVFLLEWYSGYSGTPLPIPYSSTWNMQTKVALQTLTQLQTGMRLHNAFIHWRQAGDEVGCSILYFIVALLDKWSSLLDGGQLLGLSANNTKYRMPVGFALAYYLIGAVLLDLNASKLHKMTATGQNMLIGDMKSIPEAVRREVNARRNLYWTMLCRYLGMHVWSLAIASVLLWVFDSTKESTILFLSYILAYTGLLWYQYTKIFAGPRSLKPLLVAVIIGLPLGQVLRYHFQDFMYCDTVTLGVATWTAAFLSLYYARIKMKEVHKEPGQGHGSALPIGDFHAFTDPENDPLLSQEELQIIFNNLRAMAKGERYRLDPQGNPGVDIKAILLHALEHYRQPRTALAKFALEAFPEVTELLELTISAFDHGTLLVDCVSMKAMSGIFEGVKAVSHFSHGRLHILVGCAMMDSEPQQKLIRNFCRSIAEIVLHGIAETFMGMSHDDSSLTESLIVAATLSNQVRYSPVTSNIREYLAESEPKSKRAKALAKSLGARSLNYLGLQIEAETQWDLLPREIRDLVIRRCTGQEEISTRFQNEWLIFNKTGKLPVSTFLTRCNYGAYVAVASRKYALGARDDQLDEKLHHQDSLESLRFLRVVHPIQQRSIRELLRDTKAPLSTVYHKVGVCLKLIAIAFVAEPEFQRELTYALSSDSKFVRCATMFLATGLWKYTKWLQNIVLPMFLFHGRKNISTFWSRIGGTTVSLKRQKISIENTEGMSTAFIHAPYGHAGTFKVHQYSGKLDKEPEDNAKLQRITTYSSSKHLLRREDYAWGSKTNIYRYEYMDASDLSRRKRLSKIHNPRFPISRKCVEGKNEFEEVHFNSRGLIESGSHILNGSLVRFVCHYRQGSDFEDELLRAEFALPHLTCTVSWSAPPATHPERLDKWIPHSQVTEATFVLESDVYESHWTYDHKFHPTIHTKLNGEDIDTPPIIQWDHLGVLKKPTKSNFLFDDPLVNFKSLSAHALPRWLGLNIHRNRVSTSRARSKLWNAWKNTSGFDGVIMRYLDEQLLRREPLLRPYWRRRDRGDLTGAESFLNENADAIMATVDLDNSISGWAPLAMKTGDLYSFGQGGDANSRTRRKTPDFDDGGLQVLAVDSGTWPNEGGGVSACRRDMINNLRSVSWHMIAESANDSGLPKHQTEMNVRSLKIIPLWGLDFLTPTHGLFKDRLDTEVEHIPRDATKMDVKTTFLPILAALVKGARTITFNQADIAQTTRALVNLNTYFSDSKHWSAIWTSDVTKKAWRNLWLSQDLVSPTPSETWFQTEIPSVAQLDAALDLWHRYLFIMSIPIPDRIPAIFQASHHSVSASYGVVCKIKRGSTLQIWDHAISWRETNLYLSSDLCAMAPFVRNALLGLMKVTSQLILHHADTILPCADFFNPGWEVEIGSSQGRLEHRNTFKRKIDPVVNGIPDMSKFAPIKEITSELPTVTMLSHVWYAKDIKTAILAADIIVNEWGFTDYRLDIYGAIDKAPSYSTDCFEIIASKSLPRFVNMRGEANPSTVLAKTWVFLNSSISEGLPLALGEAALTGAPVVCTDVGASLRVLTDPDTGACYSAVVAPNDARNLARAQINFLALLDEWAPYAEDSSDFKCPTITDKPTAQEVATITARMYAKTAQRRALGMRSREIVQKSFGGERYLREHEQMLWIGKARYDLLHAAPQPKRPAMRPSMPSAPVPSDMFHTAAVGPSTPLQRPQLSSTQTSELMVPSLSATTLMSPGIRSLFDGGTMKASRASTLATPMGGLRKVMPARVTLLRNEGTRKSVRDVRTNSVKIKRLPGEDTFARDFGAAVKSI